MKILKAIYPAIGLACVVIMIWTEHPWLASIYAALLVVYLQRIAQRWRELYEREKQLSARREQLYRDRVWLSDFWREMYDHVCGVQK